MYSRTINKIILILGLFLIIIGTGTLLNRSDIGQDYFSWLKSVLSDLNPLKAGISLNFPSSEKSEIDHLDYSDVEFEDVTSEEKGVFEDKGEELVEESQEEEIVSAPELMTLPDLPEIEEKLNEITEEAKQVRQEVKRLKALDEIKKEIEIIAEKVKKVGQEVNEIRILAELQERVDKIAEKTDVLTQEITELV